MAKVTIYLPDDLHARVKGADLAMSPICQQALADELDRRDRNMQATTELEQVAARLRDTQDDDYEKDNAHGREIGEAWAKHTATLKEFRAFHDAFGQLTSWVDTDLPVTLAEALFGEEQRESDQYPGQTYYQFTFDALIEGAIEGVLDIYRQVSELL